MGGGLFAAWITSWKELEQQRREIEQQGRVRMLEAADAFVGAASGALAGVRALDPAMREQTPSLGRWERLTLGELKVTSGAAARGTELDQLNESWALLGEASRQLRRVELIFGLAAGGPASRAVADADRAVSRTRDAWEALQLYYGVSRASASSSVVRRREAVEALTDAVGEAGFERLATYVPQLANALRDLVSRAVAGAAVNVDGPLEKASEGARSAVADAEDALSAFSNGAALMLLALPIQYEYEVRYRVGTDEQVRPVLVRKSRLSRAITRIRRR